MTRELPLTVLAWEGPQARAYLVAMRRAGLRPARIMVMVGDPRVRIPGMSQRPVQRVAERLQDRSNNFHPRAIRKRHPKLVSAIARTMAETVDDPLGQYAEMYDDFSFDRYSDDVTRVAANSYADPGLRSALASQPPGTIVFTGGGIVPASLFDVPGVSFVHVHTGLLPHVRGADVLLWSILVRGCPGVSAFLMTPRLDDGDVLATRELAPVQIELPAADRPDDDTLYRALFSFIDPLLRADLLVHDVLEPAPDLSRLTGTPQDTGTGVTYHFMHPIVRSRALQSLFVSPRFEAVSSAAAPAKTISYARHYERPSMIAPLRFAFDMLRVRSPERAQGLRNRQRDYSRLLDHPERFALHLAMMRALDRQAAEWPSYDYGEGYFYQSSDELGITGLRDTTARVDAYGLKELVAGRSVLEIGCNTGFLSLAIAPAAQRVVAFELNPFLIDVANAGAEFLGITNATFLVAGFEGFEADEPFDDVLSFANHHTYDGNTHQTLDEYFARCHACTRRGGRLVFESHPPALEGARFARTLDIIDRYFEVVQSEIHDYGTPLDRDRRFLVANRRETVVPDE